MYIGEPRCPPSPFGYLTLIISLLSMLYTYIKSLLLSLHPSSTLNINH